MSIFNDKALKSVAEAAAKIMGEQLKGNQHKIDANKNGKIDAHDFKLLRAKKDVKEEVEQLDEVGDTPAGRKALSSYVQKALHDKSREKGLRKATSRLYKDNYYGKKTNEEVEVVQEQLNEAFPSVEDAKKRMAAGKTATGTVTKTKTGLVHKRDFEHNAEDDDHPEKVGRPRSYGARQNYKRSTRVNEGLSFTEMLELYNEEGLKVLAPIETEEMDIDGTTIEVIDADKVNGFVETTVEEEATNDQWTKEYEDQKKSFEGKKPQPKVAAGKTIGVKNMPEEVEHLDEGLGHFVVKQMARLTNKNDLEHHHVNVAQKQVDDHLGNTENATKILNKHKKMARDAQYHKKSDDEARQHFADNLQTLHNDIKSARNVKEEVELDEADIYSIKNTKTGQIYHHSKYPITSKTRVYRQIKSKPGHEHATIHKNGKPVQEETELDERTLTSGETKKKEEYVKGMKKKLSGFKQRYGERAKEVMYATATSMAKKKS